MAKLTLSLLLLSALLYFDIIEHPNWLQLLELGLKDTPNMPQSARKISSILQPSRRNLQQPTNQSYQTLADQPNNTDDNNDNNNDTKINKNKMNSNTGTFLLIVVICSVAVSVIGIICCVAVIIKCIVMIEERADTRNKVRNSIKFNYSALCPEIQVGVFYAFVGRPLQDNCVICLEEYDKVEEHRNLPSILNINCTKDNKMKNLQPPKSREYVDQTIIIKMTVCGHVLHSKCLDCWLAKQENCPLCRQSFSQQNIKEWEKKLQSSITKTNATENQIPNQSHIMMRNSRLHHQQTLNSLPSRRDRQNAQEFLDPAIQKIERMQKQLTQEQIGIVQYYNKILAFHQKSSLKKDSKGDWRTPKGINIHGGLYFLDQGENVDELNMRGVPTVSNTQNIGPFEFDNVIQNSKIVTEKNRSNKALSQSTQFQKSSMKMKHRQTMKFSSAGVTIQQLQF